MRLKTLLVLVVWIYLQDGDKLEFRDARGFYFDRYKKNKITLMITNKPLKVLTFKGRKIKWVLAHNWTEN